MVPHVMTQPHIHHAEFRAVYDRHFDDLARYCLRRLPEPDAHDAVAEVFLVAWRRIDTMPPGDDTLPWLYGVARNVVRNVARSRRRSIRLDARATAEPQYPDPGPEVQVVRNEEDRALHRALASLRPDDQEVLRLRAFEGLSLRQISTVLACSEEAAKKRVQRALARLRTAAGIDSPATAGSTLRANRRGGER